MTTDNKLGKYKFKLSKWQFDFKNTLSLPSLMNFVLESAGQHAYERGFSIEKLIAEGKTWMLLRIRLDFYYETKEEDFIQIETWVDSIKNFYSTRRFKIYDSTGNLFCAATSVWAMIDYNNRKLLPLKELIDNKYILTGVDFPGENPSKIQQIEKDLSPIRTEKALYSAIDINNHVTTTKYIQWILDCFSLETFSKNHLSLFEINFHNEAIYNEELQIFKQDFPSYSIIELKNTKDKLICSGKVGFGIL